MPELGKVSVGFEGVAALVSQGRPVVSQALLLLSNVQVDLLAAAEKNPGSLSVSGYVSIYEACVDAHSVFLDYKI